MNYKYILGIDPSGNFKEGNGTTGICVFDCVNNKIIDTSYISAKSFAHMEDYWDAHITFITDQIFNVLKIDPEEIIVVIEDYLLYKDKAESQVHSKMETPKLIGVLQHWLHTHEMDYEMQTASLVKSRWKEEILVFKGYLQTAVTGYKDMNGMPVNKHCRDAIKHAVHYATFKNNKEALNV